MAHRLRGSPGCRVIAESDGDRERGAVYTRRRVRFRRRSASGLSWSPERVDTNRRQIDRRQIDRRQMDRRQMDRRQIYLRTNLGGGGAEGSRTPDLLIANETLYQLSYDPVPKCTRRCRFGDDVARTGFCSVGFSGFPGGVGLDDRRGVAELERVVCSCGSGRCRFRRRSRLRFRRSAAFGRTTSRPVRGHTVGSFGRAVVLDGRASLGSPMAARRLWWRSFY